MQTLLVLLGIEGLRLFSSHQDQLGPNIDHGEPLIDAVHQGAGQLADRRGLVRFRIPFSQGFEWADVFDDDHARAFASADADHHVTKGMLVPRTDLGTRFADTVAPHRQQVLEE